MRAGVRLCAGVWGLIGSLLKTIFRPRWDLEMLIQKQLLCSVQRRDCMALLPFSSLQSRVCALAALCARSELA